MVAAITRDLTLPQRSASSERGKVSRPTIRATMPLREPSWASDSSQSAFSIGKTAFRTCRDM
jgi:hypothetical protein